MNNNISAIQSQLTQLNIATTNISEVRNFGNDRNSQKVLEVPKTNHLNSDIQKDLTQDLVSLIEVDDSIEASTIAIKTKDSMIGSLLDIKV